MAKVKRNIAARQLFAKISPSRFVSPFHRFLLGQNLDEVIPVEPDKSKALMEQEDEECEEYEDEDFVTVGSEFAVSVSETGDRSTRSKYLRAFNEISR